MKASGLRQRSTTQGQRVCFGHRRLAIIDTSSAGHQPMLSHDGRFVLILTARSTTIANCATELAAKGHQFRTDTDTEVLARRICRVGRRISRSRLNGMFAFALWDNKERTLTLVRDHVGIKPLYYVFQQPRACSRGQARSSFASEVKAILASGLIKPELDPEALAPVSDVSLGARSEHAIQRTSRLCRRPIS